jgi:hypothetical protein
VAVSELLALLLASLRAAVRDRTDPVAEHLLLRHQLAVLTRPTRRRPRPCPELRELIAAMSRDNPRWGTALGETENCQVGPA